MEKNVQPSSPLDSAPWATLGSLAQLLGGELEGPADLVLTGITAADTPSPGGIAFAESEHYVSLAKSSGITALLLPVGLDSQGVAAIRVPSPRQAFFILLQRAQKPWPIAAGIHPTAVIDPQAEVDPTAQIGAYAVVERFASVKAGAKVFPFAYIGEACEVGEGAQIGPHVVLMQAVSVGPKSLIQPGAILGADGFGFVWDGTQHLKVPQVGKVILEERVEIGALTSVDRATVGETRIGAGTKLDNLIQVGHNTRIGQNTVIAGLTGLSGSSTIGSNVVMGGQCATSDHAVVGDHVVMAGRTAVAKELKGPGEFFGVPPLPVREGMRNMLLVTKLGDLFSRLRKLEKRMNQVDPEGSEK